MSPSGTKVMQSWIFKGFMIGAITIFFASTPGPAQNSSQTQQNQGSQPQSPAEAGGPQGDIGPIAVPKKAPEDEKPPEPPPKVKNPAEIGTFSMKVDVP